MQEALLHSQAVFQRQASVVEQAVLGRAFEVGGRGAGMGRDGCAWATIASDSIMFVLCNNVIVGVHASPTCKCQPVAPC